MELVKQVEVNIDYILMLVAKYHESNCTDKEILGSIDKAIKSSLALRSKKELIDTFISKINVNTDVMNDWSKFVKEQEEILDLLNEKFEDYLEDDIEFSSDSSNVELSEVDMTIEQIKEIFRCLSDDSKDIEFSVEGQQDTTYDSIK